METSFIISHGPLHIPCCLRLPTHGDVRRVVLGVHGIGGRMGDTIQAGIAEEMTLFGSASLRFDFPGHGISPENKLSLHGCIESLLAVAGYAKERFPETEDLCIFATGFGAYVTLIALEQLRELPGKVKLVIQTPSVLMHETLLSMLRISRETFRLMDNFCLATSRALNITYDFYQELANHIALTSHEIPMLILHGEKDDYVPAEHIRHFRRINEDAKLVIIPGASHQFLEEGAWDMVLDLTRDWFEFEQVLLCDWI